MSFFPNEWIGKRGNIAWRAGSPELTVGNFCGVISLTLYMQQRRIVDLNDDEIQHSSPQTFNNDRNEYYWRLYHCQHLCELRSLVKNLKINNLNNRPLYRKQTSRPVVLCD